MPLIKLFRIHTENIDTDDYYDTSRKIGEGMTDWEEVTQDELNTLRSYQKNIYQNYLTSS
jgi:hypothetical protein